MLSPDEVRRLLDRPQLTDAQAAEVRDALYAFAGTFIEQFLRERRWGRPPPGA